MSNLPHEPEFEQAYNGMSRHYVYTLQSGKEP